MPFSRLRKKLAAVGDWLVYDDANSTRFLQLITDTILRNEGGEEVQIGLRYADPEGNEDWRSIKPIAWGSSKAGNTLLVAYREPFTEDDFRTYSLPRVTGIMVQEQPSPVSEVTDEEVQDEFTEPGLDESTEDMTLPEDNNEEVRDTIPEIPGEPELSEQQGTFEIPYNPDYMNMDEPEGESNEIPEMPINNPTPVIPTPQVQMEQPIQQPMPSDIQQVPMQPTQVVDVNSLPPQLRPANIKRLKRTIVGKS